jgi:hypothetical protein
VIVQGITGSSVGMFSSVGAVVTTGSSVGMFSSVGAVVTTGVSVSISGVTAAGVFVHAVITNIKHRNRENKKIRCFFKAILSTLDQ